MRFKNILFSILGIVSVTGRAAMPKPGEPAQHVYEVILNDTISDITISGDKLLYSERNGLVFRSRKSLEVIDRVMTEPEPTWVGIVNGDMYGVSYRYLHDSMHGYLIAYDKNYKIKFNVELNTTMELGETPLYVLHGKIYLFANGTGTSTLYVIDAATGAILHLREHVYIPRLFPLPDDAGSMRYMDREGMLYDYDESQKTSSIIRVASDCNQVSIAISHEGLFYYLCDDKELRIVSGKGEPIGKYKMSVWIGSQLFFAGNYVYVDGIAPDAIYEMPVKGGEVKVHPVDCERQLKIIGYADDRLYYVCGGYISWYKPGAQPADGNIYYHDMFVKQALWLDGDILIHGRNKNGDNLLLLRDVKNLPVLKSLGTGR